LKLAAWLALALLGAPGLAIASDPVVLRAGNGAEPETLDPQKMQTPMAINVAHDLYEGLTGISPKGEVVPAAASHWEVSRDGRLYTFHLRPRLKWSNGESLTAEDFAAGLRRAVDPATGGAYAAVLSPIRNADQILAGEMPAEELAVEASDARTLKILLKGPTPYLPGLLTLPIAYPVHRPTLRKFGPQFLRPGRLVGNGAYVLDEWVVQSHVRVGRNRNYWNDANTRIDAVYFYPTEDTNSELKRYRAGELDYTFRIPRVQAPWLREHFGRELRIATFLDTYYIGFNCTQLPFRDQPQLRRALAMVIDRDVLVNKVLHGLGRAAHGWIPDAVSGHEPQAPAWAAWPMAQRIAEAQRLYAQAGYGADRALEVELRFGTESNDKRMATVVAAMWKQALGVRARLVRQEPKVLISQLKLRNVTQAFFWDWQGDYDDPSTYTDLLHSTRRQNYAGWNSPEYDALLGKAALQANPERRRKILQDAELLMLDATPLTPLYFNVSAHLVKPWVAGWEDNVLDYHYSKDLRILPH
jgi:oligopeptide transport system substrate-binding protein